MRRFLTILLPLIAAGAFSSAVSAANGEPPAAFKNSAAVETMLEKARDKSEECGNFFSWLARFMTEYKIDPDKAKDFEDQDFSGQYKRFSSSDDPTVPILKLLTDTESKKLFGKPFREIDLSEANSETFQDALSNACLNKLFSRNDGLESHLRSMRARYFGILRDAESYTRNRRVWEAISQIEEAYSKRDELLTAIKAESGNLTTAKQKEKLSEAEEIGALLWPSENAQFMKDVRSAFETTKASAATNDKNALAAQIHRCGDIFSRPDDPHRPTDYRGRSDEELSQSFDKSYLDDCNAAVQKNSLDAATHFYLGRALLFAGNERDAIQQFEVAAEHGDAAAFTYLAEFAETIDDKRTLLRISLDMGFTPARTYLAMLDQQDQKTQLEDSKLKAASEKCNPLSQHPEHPRNTGSKPVSDDDLDPVAVIEACSAAVALDPGNGRLHYQLARGLMMVEGFENQATTQLTAGAELGDPMAAFTLFQQTDDANQAMAYLKIAAKGGLKAAEDILARTPVPPKKVSLEMIYQDPAKVKRLLMQIDFPDVIKASSADCKSQHGMIDSWQLFAAAKELWESTHGRQMGLDLHSALMRSSESELRSTIYSWCETSISEIYGDCIDPYLTDFNGDVFDRLDKSMQTSLIIANSQQAEKDPDFFDKNVGALTDYIAYFYARRTGLISPWEYVAFDGNNMFTGDTDEYVRGVVEEIKTENKLFIITGAFDNHLLCQ